MLLIENPKNNKKLYVKCQDLRRHVLWELESYCNLRCKYCYDSRTRNIRISEHTIKGIIEKINESDLEYIHVTGGEPTLNPYFGFIINSLQSKQICITTNLVEFSEHLKNIFFSPNVHSIAISLDSVDEAENNFLRGKTKEVLFNIQELLLYRKRFSAKLKIRIHSVISKVNIDSLENLLEWAKIQNIDEVSCQPISLSYKHPYYKVLALTVDDLNKIFRIFKKENSLFNAQYADSHSKLLEYYLTSSDCYTLNGHQLCHPYIDASGVIWNCPRKLYTIQDSFYNDSKIVNGCIITPQCMCCLKRHKYVDMLL